MGRGGPRLAGRTDPQGGPARPRAEWRKAETLPGVTVDGDGAQVRVFPPVPLDGWPKELAKLQVSGTDLDDPEPVAAVTEPGLPVLWLNPGLDMSAGKAMAQAGHAAQLAWWELTGAERAAWQESGFRLAVRTAPRERWAELGGADCRWSGTPGSPRSRRAARRWSPTIRRCGPGCDGPALTGTAVGGNLKCSSERPPLRLARLRRGHDTGTRCDERGRGT